MTRTLGVVVLVSTASLATAQLSPYLAVRRAVEFSQRRPTQNPLDPPGNPGLPPKEATLPAPGEPDRTFKIIKSGDTHYAADEVHITGGGEVLIRGYRVFADSARGVRSTEIWELNGNVKVIGKDSVVTGERVIVDFKNETYRSFESESQVDPQFLGTRRVRDKLYIDGRESYGTQRLIRSVDGSVTSCNYDHPHYELVGADTEVRPGKRAILRRVRVRLFNRTLFTLPFLVIPLEERNYKYTPEVGQSRDEGYYIKNRYGVPLRSGQVLDTRLDHMTKLGTGTGLGYNYGGAASNGEARVYKIFGPADTLNFNNRHQQNLRWGQLTLENDLQRNNYLAAPGSSIMQNRANLNVPWGGGTSRLGLNRSNNETQGFTTTNQTLSFGDQRRWSRTFNTRLDLNHISNQQQFQGGTTGNGKREQMDVLLRAEQDLRRATASLDYQRSIPIGDTQNFFSGSDRTPVVTLASDARRLFGDRMEKALPFRTELSVGEFQSQTDEGRITRSAFDFNFQKYDRSQKRFRADFTGQFRQGLYSDDTAQYTLAGGSALSYRTSRDTSVNFRYNYLRPYGFTPLTTDRTGRTNLYTLDASARFFRHLKMGLQTGYDSLRLERQDTPWQQVGVRTEYEPTKWFLFRALTNYDTFQRQWSNVRLDLTYRPGATLLSVGARYDGIRQSWSSVNIVLENLKMGRTRLSAVLQYNGFTKQFDQKQYSVIYDLHCAEAIVNVIENNVGFRAGREVQFLIRLKAFPFGTNFGTGRRGQPLGTGTGSF
ncbi:MAG: hypothetical protein ACO1SV_11135 [Fimbriimonas sp.]